MGGGALRVRVRPGGETRPRERRETTVSMSTPEMIETLDGIREMLRRSTEDALALDSKLAYVMIAAVSAVKDELDDRWERE